MVWRVISGLVALTAAGCTVVPLEPVYPDRVSADVARERSFQAIFNRSAEGWVNLTPDLQAVRHVIEPEADEPARHRMVPPPPLDFSRIFSVNELTMADVIRAIEETSPYRFVIDPAFDRSARVSLNDQYNRIDDLLDYLARKTNSSMVLFESSRRILVISAAQQNAGEAK